MRDKRFEPLLIRLRQGAVAVGSTQQALDLLSDPEWPVRGPRHRDATDACLKVLDGHRSTDDARRAFADAVEEARLSV